MIKKLFPLGLGLLMSLFASNTHIQAQQLITSADKVIATVGNEIILASDIEAQYILLKNQGGAPENARALILDQLLSNALLVAHAERDSVVVEDTEVEEQLDSRINQILAYMGNSTEQFTAYYGFSPVAMKEKMRDDMRRQLLVQKMQQKISGGVSITPKEVKDFFERIPKDSLPYFNSEVELAEIVIKPKVSQEEDNKARFTAEELRVKLLDSDSLFCELAQQYSNDRGSAAQCGRIGLMPRGQLVPEYELEAYRLDKNEISEVVKSEFGYHVIQLLQRLGNSIDTRHILIRPLIHLEDVELAKKFADSIKQLILIDSISFDQAIQKYSEEEMSKNRNGDMVNPATGETLFETGDLDPEIFFAIENLRIGEITDPIEFKDPMGNTFYRLIRLRNRTEPHIANLADDYHRIAKAALEEKRTKQVNEWTIKQIPKHAISINWNTPFGKSTLADYTKNEPIMDKWRKS